MRINRTVCVSMQHPRGLAGWRGIGYFHLSIRVTHDLLSPDGKKTVIPHAEVGTVQQKYPLLHTYSVHSTSIVAMVE